MDELLADLGQRIRNARELRGLTQEKLAERVGINNSFLSQIERGLKAPSLKTLHALATDLGVGVGQLFGDEETITSALVEQEVAALLAAAPASHKKALVDLLRAGIDLTGR